MIAHALLLLSLLQSIPPSGPTAEDAQLELGFRHMYALRFDEAQAVFANWQTTHPDDPRGPVSEAAGLLFSELNRLGILETQFFENDESFDARSKMNPDPQVRDRFESSLSRARSLAEHRLAKGPRDRHALFTMTLVNGLEADYLALIEKDNLAALKSTRAGSEWAKKLLAVDPTYYDAYLATGVSNYIVGSVFAPLRWLLRLGGYSGNRKEGIKLLTVTAERGRLLAPFARLLLAVAYLRADDRAAARRLLVGLRDDFPSNPLFAKEIARLDQIKEPARRN